MEKIWLKSYPFDVPHEINPDEYSSLNEVILSSIDQYGDLPAFHNLGVTLSFNEVKEKAELFSVYLQRELGLVKGDRIAIMLPNVLQYPIAVFGAFFAGLVVVNVNPLYTKEELIHQLRDAEVKAIVVLSNMARTLQLALPSLPFLKHTIVCNIGDFFSAPKAWFTQFMLKYVMRKIPSWSIPAAVSFNAALKKSKKSDFRLIELKGNDIAFLQYTGGTTGISKGAMLTHRNLVANLLQSRAWYKPVLNEKNELIMSALPFYHIFSLTANCLFFFLIGGLNVLVTNPRDVERVLKTMSTFSFTTLTGVNTLFSMLLKHPRFERVNFKKLKLVLGGGMAVQEVIASQWQRVTGSIILEAYGLTETSPCVAMNPYTEKSYNGTVGLPVSSTSVAILDPDGALLPSGEMGEVAIKGPQVMLGYWRNESETKKVFTKDGWLLTGDIGMLTPKGYLKILERKKDMIIVSGFNVYPTEVEDVIVKMQGVKEAAVVGVKDDASGEAVKACIVKSDPAIMTEDVIRFCKQFLTGYKIPKLIMFYDELPKSNVGKILRRALKD